MAEFCLDCWNKINETDESEWDYVLSEDLELCEGCGEFKHVIIMERTEYYTHKFGIFAMPIMMACNIVYIIRSLILLPYLIFKRLK